MPIMRINHPLFYKLGGLAGATAVRLWMSTLDCQGAFYDPVVDPGHQSHDGRQRIYVFWHEYLLWPLHMRGHCNLSILLSRHRDAEILSYAARHMGFSIVRGSSNRGGMQALRDLMDRSKRTNLAITPDGPRGPRRVLAQGPVYLASRLQMPLVCLGLAYDRPWRLNSWDQFAIPRPRSRARGVIGPELHIPDNLDRGGIEHYRQQVERLLNRLTSEAETWAESGRRKREGVPLRKEQARLHLRPPPESQDEPWPDLAA
jgi:lysophospholipid acyltransferase (LPLAT)-like uncharacterized protein